MSKNQKFIKLRAGSRKIVEGTGKAGEGGGLSRRATVRPLVEG